VPSLYICFDVFNFYEIVCIDLKMYAAVLNGFVAYLAACYELYVITDVEYISLCPFFL